MTVTAIKMDKAQGLAPFSMKDAPSFIEAQFPVGRLSAEAYKERTAVQGQLLTTLGTYWKGRKPLILARAVVLGALLPMTHDPITDLDTFLKLMAMDDGAFGRRFDGSVAEFAWLFPDHAETVASNRRRAWRTDLSVEELKRRAAAVRPASDIADAIEEPILAALMAFVKSARVTKPNTCAVAFAKVFSRFADDLTEEVETPWRWREDLDDRERQARVAEAFASMPYAERLKNVRRPEECDEAKLLAPVWAEVNEHIGTNAQNLPGLVEQLGIARFGHRPRVADTFCGGGSIPFEAARIGCDVYASDLNPIACMLTWGAFNIIGASPEKRAEIENAQKEVAAAVDAEITKLGIEHDKDGNRAKAFLYCLETRCPKTGWMVPMAPSWVISKTRNVVAKLVPDPAAKRYRIDVHTAVSKAEMAEAEKGTVQGGRLVHPMNPERSGVEIKTIRGDYRDADGVNRNRLRLWEKSDFIPRPDDIFQERLYCIQWITKETLGKGRQETFFASVSEGDLFRERRVEEIVRENLARWQDDGLVPDMKIEPGENTTQPIRERGWTYWHHLFQPRNILFYSILRSKLNMLPPLEACALVISFAKTLDWGNKLCYYGTGAARESISHLFSNQAFNTFLNYGIRGTKGLLEHTTLDFGPLQNLLTDEVIKVGAASQYASEADLFVTDPPYADAINYHEITEFFIAWLRKSPPPPFDQWIWDSRRDLAIKGKDEHFRRDMVAAYAAMTKRMPDNGLQVVMFTHQDAGVWADLGGILWAAGLRVTAAWNIVTETEKPTGEGNYVQGTICLVLRKRLGESNARRMEIEAEIEESVREKLAKLEALDDAWSAETLYTDGDLTLAAYAAALQVVTSYSTIDRQLLDRDLYRNLKKGERTMIRDFVDYAAEVANGLLVPENFPRDMWRDLAPSERFYVRMLDMEANGATKVADFQNFGKSFAYGDYASLMASTTANAASLKGAADFKGQMLASESDKSDGFAKTQLRQVLFAVWKTLEKENPKLGVTTLHSEYAADYWQRRQKLIALSEYIAAKTKHTRPEESSAAHELAEALKLDRV
jgi:putative DNA methylase